MNQTSTEIDLSYNFESGWYIQTDPTITYDWSATPRQALTLPVGIDVGKVTKIGGQDVSFQLGAYERSRARPVLRNGSSAPRSLCCSRIVGLRSTCT